MCLLIINSVFVGISVPKQSVLLPNWPEHTQRGGTHYYEMFADIK